MAPKRKDAPTSSKEKGKVSTSNTTARTHVDDRGMRRFQSLDHKTIFDSILAKRKMWLERQLILEDFKDYEIEIFIHRA